jgi:hypothetical protein
LLLLGGVADWLGRRRLPILGKDGLSAVQDRGEKTLSDILNQDDAFGTDNDAAVVVDRDDGWTEGVGEGRSDEANLSAYFRMSEGDDEDSQWKTEGVQDLSPYQNKGLIVGNPESFSLEASTSSVDEGEQGKVKSLYDLVFQGNGESAASGFVIPALRGGSLDIGVFHTREHEARQKASIEFWFFLPALELVKDELVLVRRTKGLLASSLETITLASEKDCVLWELVVQRSGEVEFRACSGASLLSSANAQSVSESKEANDAPHLVTFNRWNHICLVLSARGLAFSDCVVTMLLKGIEVATMTTSMLPAGVPKNDTAGISAMMKESHMVFGLNCCSGFRLTELRVWACERSAEDTLSFLYEYLTAAEQKKKFKVKIANKNKKGVALGKGLGLAPPKGLSASLKASAAPSAKATASHAVGVSLAPPPKEELKFSLEPGKPSSPAIETQCAANEERRKNPSGRKIGGPPDSGQPPPRQPQTVSESSHKRESSDMPDQIPTSSTNIGDDVEEDGSAIQDGDADVATTLWDTAIPLSQQLRPSAAAALIRGPPATRHYGGNRGGLPDFSGIERFGVGGIAVCGSEKTIVFRDNEDPPALTYPIGASGAIVSDQMDDEGSEFLCCFLAKEGRMVVFELRSRTVVVELQMTTKLNFWRYLQPEAAGNTLCFMLVTPVGGFHWKPLEESPRPHQVWKRGSELQGKKVVSYEEGGSNGLDGVDICSRAGLVLVTRASSGLSLEAWLLPISGDSKARQISDDLLGACLCQPLTVDDGPFLPMIVTATSIDDGILVNILNILEPKKGSLTVGEIYASQVIEEGEMDSAIYAPPALAMGPLPMVLCVSLANIVVVIVRRKGLVAAFELEDGELNTIAMENVDHFVIDAVMRYSPDFGGAEIVMLLSDDQNSNDGRIVSFCFRSAT